MTDEQIARARWTLGNPHHSELIARAQDGGVVLARIERVEGARRWRWTAGAVEDEHARFYAAQRAVRKTLRKQEGE